MNDDLDKIKMEAKQRGISRLCHFTQSRKVAQILTEFKGILSTAQLIQKAPDILDKTDELRINGQLNHICCSIEFPNIWYLKKIKNRELLFDEWVIILIKPDLLWDEGTQFCPVNAATKRGGLIRSGYSGFIELFKQEIEGAQGRIQRRTEKMLSCCPTDDQAEVQVKDYISMDKINGIVVPNEEQARREITRLSILANSAEVKWYISPDLFTRKWSDEIRKGKRPFELVYESGNKK